MDPISLYIHVPFCQRKCLFCSFAIAVGQESRREEYVEALGAEMKKYEGQKLKTIYLGGGTPTLLDEKHLDALMSAVRKYFSFTNDIEVTIEANPESISNAKARFLKDRMFNRVSLGVQSLNDRYLKFLGRAHDAQTACQAYHILRDGGFSNISLDLMYSFPGQSQEELQQDARSISLLGSEHLSLYSLSIEPNSRFFAARTQLDDNEKLAQHYLLIGRILSEHGFRQYEISNYSKLGFESIHNRNYWLGGPYLGIGVGAHGFDGKRRCWNTSRLGDYLKRSAHGKDVLDGYEDLTDNQLVMEKILFGLRMNEGVSWDIVPANKSVQLQGYIEDGFLMLDKGRLQATLKGRLVLDELSARLI